MDLNQKEIQKTLNTNKIWVPVLLGLGIVGYMFYQNPENLASMSELRKAKIGPLVLSFFVILARDAGYVYRIRTLTEQKLTWVRSIYVIILWEFASAVTPSVVGGTAVAIFILLKEKIKLGSATAYVMLTSILDNAFFIIFAPLVLLYTGLDVFPVVKLISINTSLQSLFWVSYGLIALYCFIFSYALFIKPRGFKWVLLKVTSWRPFRRWRKGAYEYGNDILGASANLRGKPASYWMKIIVSTVFVWSARYLMLNCLISSFVDVDFADQMRIFASQIVMWIIMLISPTPGSSGTAEFFFNEFFNQYLGNLTFVTSIVWRMLSYYPYLILGAIFLPRWVRQRFFKNSKS
ncbi:lysylphosphatidylglycerol synthase transmembrane domain-containing protein [Aureibacter tunicatorum]|uniref:Flippase-like domain-containing protein n=1 Tax=Aureibacter tunicatorum TaxID=866807 RepID=A0AAE4BT82_9BACT|nr:lysylphosphatidylglycerol synthase transmembrane domain-containing protein [Aureibacter tunicatorum]MDR6239680.1 hypothetical protein [Aureibacter tunicatorum]BDD04156.1 hypothetical protein AUTU_16390 [Aureibacter tunicatorum]